MNKSKSMNFKLVLATLRPQLLRMGSERFLNLVLLLALMIVLVESSTARAVARHIQSGRRAYAMLAADIVIRRRMCKLWDASGLLLF